MCVFRRKIRLSYTDAFYTSWWYSGDKWQRYVMNSICLPVYVLIFFYSTHHTKCELHIQLWTLHLHSAHYCISSKITCNISHLYTVWNVCHFYFQNPSSKELFLSSLKSYSCLRGNTGNTESEIREKLQFLHLAMLYAKTEAT